MWYMPAATIILSATDLRPREQTLSYTNTMLVALERKKDREHVAQSNNREALTFIDINIGYKYGHHVARQLEKSKGEMEKRKELSKKH